MHKQTILIIDDEEVARKSLSRILELEGYRVVAVESGDEALTLLDRQPVDLIIVDLKMPNMSGMELINRALDKYPNLAVIVLTAYGTLESVIEALRRRVKDYLLKPASTDDILRSVERVLSEGGQPVRTAAEARSDYQGGPPIYTMSNGAKIDVRKHVIQYDDRSLVLTPTEARFMGVLLEQYGQVVPHDEIVTRMYGYQVSEEEAAAVLRPIVSRLRKKLNVLPGARDWIQTVRSSGYIFSAGKLV